MAVVIRLTRGGAKKRPFYHIVAADSRKARDGRYIERLGYYNPIATGQEIPLFLEQDRITYWTQQGAKPSERVANLLKQFSLGKLKSVPAAEQGLGKAKRVDTAPKKAPTKAAIEAKAETNEAKPDVKAAESVTEPPKAEAKPAETSAEPATETPKVEAKPTGEDSSSEPASKAGE
jgi:small subunit ribosomal protein S16